MRCIFLSRNRDNSRQGYQRVGYQSVSPGSAQPFPFNFQALCRVPREPRGQQGRCHRVPHTRLRSGSLPCSGPAQSTPQLLLSRAWQCRLRLLCLLAREAVGQAYHSTPLQTPARAAAGTGVAGSQLEQLARCQSGSLVPRAGGTACPSPGLEGALRSLTVASGLSSFALCRQLVATMAFFLVLQTRIGINSKRPLPLRFSKITDQARTPFPYSPAC